MPRARLAVGGAGGHRALCFLHRPKKLRFHPKQLYFSARQGELQKVLLMLGEHPPSSPPPSRPPSHRGVHAVTCGNRNVLSEFLIFLRSQVFGW